MTTFSADRVERFDVLSRKLWRETLEESPAVVEDRTVLTIDAVSNDTYYTGGKTWGMYGDKTSPANAYGSQAGEAWAAGHVGSMKVAIGVIDSGVDYTHRDLYSNIWLNQGEIPFSMRSLLVDTDKDRIITFRDLNSVANSGLVKDLNGNGRIDGGDLLKDKRWANGIDEAGNGYKDDLIGWDFAGNDNNPFDEHGHGTHVAGTIAARGGDGVGVAGVAWKAQIVPLKFMDASGVGYSDAAARAIDYFTAARSSNYGIDFAATNNSWGGGGYTKQLHDAITRAAKADILFVAAAGNSGRNNDATAYYPSSYNTASTAGYDNVIAVAAITSSGSLASFSNYGSTRVDIGAPGTGILSTTKDGGWGSMSGTSMAAPHVAGAIALFSAANPGYSAKQIKAELLSSGIKTASLDGKTLSDARLDVANFVSVGTTSPTPSPTPSPSPSPSPDPDDSLKTLFGTTSSETIWGGSVAEKIFGIASVDSLLGRNTKDVLLGRGGNDVFMLGDARGVFYNDGVAGTSGRSDYASIRDFAAGDKIMLAGDAGDYVVKSEWLGRSGAGIYLDTNNNNGWDSGDEFVAHVGGTVIPLDINADYYVFG